MIRYALDRSARYYDADGRLHVRATNISKATVNPYYGREIPGSEDLGLKPDGVYQLLRDPDELAAAAPTFNNLQLLDRHVPVSAQDYDSHQAELTVGSTGTDAVFDEPYLRNSLVVWSKAAIAGIEADRVRELSCAYRYVADMTPGTYKGLHYDGIMRNIVGNHVSLVSEGRAGPDVVVSDSKPRGLSVRQLSRTALMLQGALVALVTPRLAADQAFDPSGLLRDVTAHNLKSGTDALAARVVRVATPRLATDATLDVDDVVKIIGALEGAEHAVEENVEEDMAVMDADGDMLARICAMLEGKVDDDTLASIAAMRNAPAAEDGDEDAPVEEEKDKPPVYAAMDAGTIRREAIREVQAINTAKADAHPFVGALDASFDSAAAVYRFALDSLGVDLKGVHPSAFGAILRAQPKPGAANDTAKRPTLAQDAKAETSFIERFPAAGKLKRAI